MLKLYIKTFIMSVRPLKSLFLNPSVNTAVLILLLIGTITLSCSTTSKDLKVDQLKETERIYTGQIQIELNDKKTDHLTCDFFLNTDLGPTFRMEPDGFFIFKSPKKNLTLSEIVCIVNIDGKNQWVSHNLDLKKIKQPDNPLQVSYLGNLKITWKVDLIKDIQNESTRFGEESNGKLKNIGKFDLKVSTDFNNHQALVDSRFPELKTKNMSHSETLL